MSLSLKFKHSPPYLPSATHNGSDTLRPSSIPPNSDARAFYLKNSSLVPPPLISHSSFVPKSLVAHLMRKKKDSALAVKFEAHKRRENWDRITDIEGALHTFLTPVVSNCEMIGDHVYKGRHEIVRFGRDKQGRVLVREVVLSAAVHMDFEYQTVMMRICRLGREEVRGLALEAGWGVLGTEEKQDEGKRWEYDEALRRHLVYHLLKDRRLPARREITSTSMDLIIPFLEFLISSEKHAPEIIKDVRGRFTETHDQVVSLEFLLNTAIQQALNEFSALEALCGRGYVYTYNPAAIFAKEIGAPLLNRLMVLALKTLSDQNVFIKMRIFAFSDFADPGIIPLITSALRRQTHVRVLKKDDLFRGPGGVYDVGKFPEAHGASLVIHNNSDGFGQNIETEGMFESLDGAIGCSGSGAASLRRDRGGLLDFVF